MIPPANIPDQNQDKPPFPAWRLNIGVINATEYQLDAASASCRAVVHVGGCLVVAGLVLEVLITARHASPSSFEGEWGNLIANGLVAFGVLIEVLFNARGHKFDSELTQLSKDRAIKAEQATEQLRKEVAWRTISQAQGDAIVAALKGLKTRIWLQHLSDPETMSYASLVGGVLNEAGFEIESTQFFINPAIGLGVSPNGDGPKIMAAFSDAGLQVHILTGYPTGSASGQVVVSVGPKPNPLTFPIPDGRSV